jgi:hypothetical protein
MGLVNIGCALSIAVMCIKVIVTVPLVQFEHIFALASEI